jgi:uncharacterized membrane protein YhaH (DUF805 family)
VQATADQKAIDSSYRRLREKYDPEHNKDAVGADALRHVLADTLEDNILDGNAVDRARDANEALFYHILKDAVAARPDVRAYVDKTARALAESSRRLSVAYGVLRGPARRAEYNKSRGRGGKPPELEIYCFEWLLEQFRSSGLAHILAELGQPTSGTKDIRVERILSRTTAARIDVPEVLAVAQPEALRRVSGNLGVQADDISEMVQRLSGGVRYISWADRATATNTGSTRRDVAPAPANGLDDRLSYPYGDRDSSGRTSSAPPKSAGFRVRDVFDPSGRFSRSEFVLVLIATVPAYIAVLEAPGWSYVLAFPLVWILVVSTVRRLHDRGHSGWPLVLWLVPVANLGLFLYLLLASGVPTTETKATSYESAPERTVGYPNGGLTVGLFGRQTTDEQWVSGVRPFCQAAAPLVPALREGLNTEDIEKQFVATQQMLLNLTPLAKAVKKVPKPTSPEAVQAKNSLDNALKDYVMAAKQGERFFKGMAGGVDQRARHETGIAQRAAVGRLASYDFLFKELSSSANSNWDQAAEYLERVG